MKVISKKAICRELKRLPSKCTFVGYFEFFDCECKVYRTKSRVIERLYFPSVEMVTIFSYDLVDYKKRSHLRFTSEIMAL